jgi:hypothetical protein
MYQYDGYSVLRFSDSSYRVAFPPHQGVVGNANYSSIFSPATNYSQIVSQNTFQNTSTPTTGNSTTTNTTVKTNATTNATVTATVNATLVTILPVLADFSLKVDNSTTYLYSVTKQSILTQTLTQL